MVGAIDTKGQSRVTTVWIEAGENNVRLLARTVTEPPYVGGGMQLNQHHACHKAVFPCLQESGQFSSAWKIQL